MAEAAPLTFEQALAELERIVHELEDGQIGLEEALVRYETGIGLIRGCYGHLREAEQRILLLTGVDEEGKPLARPFSHQAAVESLKAAENGSKPREASAARDGEQAARNPGGGELPF